MSARKYKTRPEIQIEALQWTGKGINTVTDMLNFCPSPHSNIYQSPDDPDHPEHEGEYEMQVNSLEGLMSVPIGNYVIKGTKGEFYSCDPEVFETKYMPVKESTVNPESSKKVAQYFKSHLVQAMGSEGLSPDDIGKKLFDFAQEQGVVSDSLKFVKALGMANGEVKIMAESSEPIKYINVNIEV